jgi:hypothetical protein
MKSDKGYKSSLMNISIWKGAILELFIEEDMGTRMYY